MAPTLPGQTRPIKNNNKKTTTTTKRQNKTKGPQTQNVCVCF